MAKKYKVRRYGYEWGGQRKHWWQRTLATVLVVAAAAGIGWFAYEPVYNFVVGIGAGMDRVSSSSQSPSAAAPSEAAPSSTPPEGTPVPEVSGMPQRLYYLPEATVATKTQLDTALAAIKAEGADAVLFDLKSERGLVLYDSKLPIVTQNLALAEQTYSLTELIASIKSAGLTPVGRLFTFKDTTSTASMSEAAVKYMDSKINWIDNAKSDGGKAWLNPNSPLARDYILQLVDEVTKSGVSYLVIDGVQFPTGFSLNMATYGGTPDKSAVLADFVTAAQQHADQNGAMVYPVVTLDAVAGVNSIPYGENPEKLITATGKAILDVRPEQFGIGITTSSFMLTKPLLTPYETLKTALATAETLTAQTDLELVAMVQAYTSTRVESAANKPYTDTEIAEQVKAAEEAGMNSILYYNPMGTY